MSFLKTMFNSVARTFGRILAYALIGMAIYFIASKVNAQPQYRISTDSWGNWTDLTLENNYQFATNTTTSWSAYIQLKDTVAFENNKTYNLNATFEIKLTQSGTKEIFSALNPYIYNGSTLTNVSDKCTVIGTRNDKTTSPLVTTTHTYKGSINCVGLKGTGYYPYLTFRFYSNTAAPTAFQFKIDRWEYHIGSDSTDANNIMNNANQNTQTIVENNNQNTESIINNQNENTTQVIEALENQNKVCIDERVYSLEDMQLDGYLNSQGNITINSNWYTSDYIPVNSDKTYTIKYYSIWNYPAVCTYDENLVKLNCTQYIVGQNEISISNASYVRFSMTQERPSFLVIADGQYCYDYREKETEQNEEIVDNLHNMLTLLQSDDAPSGSNISSAFGGVNLTDETPFTNLLMFPVLIFSYFSNSMSNSCSPVVLGSLYGHELSLPCLNLPNYLGLTLWNIIDLLFVFYMIYNIAHLFIGILEDITELRSPFLRFFIKNKGVVNHD